MGRCPHNNVQAYTECCMDCGRNIYESDADYEKYLRGLEASREGSVIEKLEKKLGIKHPGNDPMWSNR